MENHVFKKIAFERLETLEMTWTRCRILHMRIWGEIIVSHRRHIVPLPYLLLQIGLPKESIRRMRIGRNRQFGIFFDISVFTLQIDVSIWNRPQMEKPMMSYEKGGFKEQISILKKSIILQFFCFLKMIFAKPKPTI